MTTTTSRSALARLAELDAVVEAAKAREQRVQADRSRARREAAAAAWELDAYFESLGGGELEDADTEAKLAAASDRASGRAADPAWAARARGAEQARERAEHERDEYLRSAFERLAAEEAALDAPVTDRLQAAFEEREAAEAAYVGRVRRWHRFARAGILDPGDVPRNPLHGSGDEVRGRFARGIESPTPRSLRETAT